MQEGSDWFEQCSAPFEAPCISVVYAKFHSPQGKWGMSSWAAYGSWAAGCIVGAMRRS